MRSLYPPLKVSHQQTSSYFKKKKLIRIKTEIATDSIDLPKIVQSTKQTNNYSNCDLKNTPQGIKKKNLGDSDDFFKRILEMPNRKKATLLPSIYLSTISTNDNEKESSKKGIINSGKQNNKNQIFGITNSKMNKSLNVNKEKELKSSQKQSNFSQGKKNQKLNSKNDPIKTKSANNSRLYLNAKSEEKETKNNNYDQIIKNYLRVETNYYYRNNYASCTQKGILNCFLEDDTERIIQKENNQDRSIILNNVCDVENYSIYGIMDGHGTNGHYVAEFIKTKIEEIFCSKILYTDNPNKKLNISIIKKKLCKNNYKLIKDFYKEVNGKLEYESFDVSFSGSTCLLIFRLEKELICANTGDSRSIIIENFKKITQLNIEHKPDLPEEKKRIESYGAVVSQCNDLYDDGMEGGPYRVWEKGCDYPGIAMSRSIGDKISKGLGVIITPDIKHYCIVNKSFFYLVMASDGVWEFISNEKVMEICNNLVKDGNVKDACINVIKESFKKWLDYDTRVDDITINIIIVSK